MSSEWRQTERVAWTDREGPEPGPRPVPTWAWVASAGCIAASALVLLVTDALCPEHRQWVQVLGVGAMVASVLSIVGAVRGWAGLPWLLMSGAALGLAIGVVDAAHAPVRGALVLTGYAGALVLGTWMGAREVAAHHWERRVRQDLIEPDAEDRALGPVEPPVDLPVPDTTSEAAASMRERLGR